VRKAKTRNEARILDNKKDRYITLQYLDKVNKERKINHKEPYCLGFIMHNMMKYDEMNNVLDKFPGVAKLSNRYFINQAKISCKDYLFDVKEKEVKPDVGDIIVLRRSNGTHHAVTYIGKNMTFSANGSDHGGRSELKKVGLNYWKRQAADLYVFKSKEVVKKYWQDKYKKNNATKLEFLTELYKDREVPREIALLIKEEKDNKNYYMNSVLVSNGKNNKSSTIKSTNNVIRKDFNFNGDIKSYASIEDMINKREKVKNSRSLISKRANKANRVEHRFMVEKTRV
jgi:hypothetical protein